MAENTQDVKATAPDAQPGATPNAGTPAGEKQAFVPFFNPEYEFRLGALGDVGIAYRLAAIFIFMLVAAVMMYMCAWWWVGTHPLAHHGG